jgi:hypothetical protein
MLELRTTPTRGSPCWRRMRSTVPWWTCNWAAMVPVRQSSTRRLSDLIAKSLIYIDILIFRNVVFRLKSMGYTLKSDSLLGGNAIFWRVVQGSRSWWGPCLVWQTGGRRMRQRKKSIRKNSGHSQWQKWHRQSDFEACKGWL